MRRPAPARLVPILLALAAATASAQSPRDDPDSPDYLRGPKRPQAQAPQAQGQGQSPGRQGAGLGQVAAKPRPAPTPEPRAILAIADAINDLAFDRKGQYVAVAGGEHPTSRIETPGNAQVWDVSATPPEKVATVAGHLCTTIQSVAFSPTEDILAVGDMAGGLLLTQVVPSQARRAAVDVDWREGPAPRADHDWTGAVASLTFSPDGKSVAFLPSIGPRVRVHDATDGREARYWKGGRGGEVIGIGFDGGHPVLLVVDDVTAFGERNEGGEYVTILGVGGGRITTTMGLVKDPAVIAFAPDGRCIAHLAPYQPGTAQLRDRVVTIHSAVEGKGFVRYRCPVEPRGLAFDRTGERLAVYGEGLLVLLDARTAKPLDEFRAEGRLLGPVAFSPDGPSGLQMAVGADREVILWGISPSPREPVALPAEPGVIPPPR